MSMLYGVRERDPRVYGGQKMRRRPDLMLSFSIVSVIVLILVGGISLFSESAAERDCRKKGYPTAQVNWGGLGTAYCIKRVDQTDVVVPLESLP